MTANEVHCIEEKSSKLCVIDFGASIQELWIDGVDLVLGFDHAEDYPERNKPYFGSVCGRVANRISGGGFSLGEVFHPLDSNGGQHHLHGGYQGFSHRFWAHDADGPGISMRLTSPDGDQGYPGQVDIKVTYQWLRDKVLGIDYFATTDRPTLLNPTQHSYFNLNGHGFGSIKDHLIRIHAQAYTELDTSLVPTGRQLPVVGSSFDFSQMAPMLGYSSQGCDLNFQLGQNPNKKIKLAAEVRALHSGQELRVYTDQLGLQFYTANYLGQQGPGKNQIIYGPHSGFCLEAQNLPDGANVKGFPSPVLYPGDLYRQTTIYDFNRIELSFLASDSPLEDVSKKGLST